MPNDDQFPMPLKDIAKRNGESRAEKSKKSSTAQAPTRKLGCLKYEAWLS
jgi:hypothetical protein